MTAPSTPTFNNMVSELCACAECALDGSACLKRKACPAVGWYATNYGTCERCPDYLSTEGEGECATCELQRDAETSEFLNIDDEDETKLPMPICTGRRSCPVGKFLQHVRRNGGGTDDDVDVQEPITLSDQDDHVQVPDGRFFGRQRRTRTRTRSLSMPVLEEVAEETRIVGGPGRGATCEVCPAHLSSNGAICV